MRRPHVLAFIPLALGACDPDQTAPSAPTAEARLETARHGFRLRPMSGTCQTTFEFVAIEFARATVQHSGTCQLTHLGRTTLRKEEVVDFTVTPAHVSGRAVFTAANGDQLWATEAADVGPLDETGVFTFVGEWSFAAGTGRFLDASGAASFTGDGQAETMTTNRSLRGQIRY